jgi:hypothetical protein
MFVDWKGTVHGSFPYQSEVCDDSTSALLEFARENLMLKRELHIANSELTRLQGVVQVILFDFCLFGATFN